VHNVCVRRFLDLPVIHLRFVGCWTWHGRRHPKLHWQSWRFCWAICHCKYGEGVDLFMYAWLCRRLFAWCSARMAVSFATYLFMWHFQIVLLACMK
jgi:hypothetical protein